MAVSRPTWEPSRSSRPRRQRRQTGHISVTRTCTTLSDSSDTRYPAGMHFTRGPSQLILCAKGTSYRILRDTVDRRSDRWRSRRQYRWSIAEEIQPRTCRQYHRGLDRRWCGRANTKCHWIVTKWGVASWVISVAQPLAALSRWRLSVLSRTRWPAKHKPTLKTFKLIELDRPGLHRASAIIILPLTTRDLKIET